MSERVNKIVLSKKDYASIDILFITLSQQLRILLEAGYNCFVSDLNPKKGEITIEYSLADPALKNSDLPQPCWLYPDELAYLSYYQLQQALKDAKEAVSDIEKEISSEFENLFSDNDDKKDKDGGGEA